MREEQISIFDFVKDTGIELKDLSMKAVENDTRKVETAICTQRFECDAYPIGCGGTIEPCRFGGPFKWDVCKFSHHKCNKEELWKVADSLDAQKKCPKECCRNCKVKLCGARCNGSEEPQEAKQCIDNVPHKEEKLTLDNLRPCDCGYTGRKAVAVTGCGIPTNGYLNGPRIYEKYLFEVFCPVCYRTATSGPHSEWASNKTDKQQAMQDWQKYPLKESYTWRHEYLKKHADEMDETVRLFEGFVEEVEE